MPTTAAPTAEAVFLLLLVVGATVYLAAPPALEADLAQTQCEQLVVDRLDGVATDAEASWERLPFAHWSCAESDTEVADFGWWASDSSGTEATLR